MHYLITGGNRFIGTHLTLRFLKQGHQVTVLDNYLCSPANRLAHTKANIIEGSVLDRELVFSLAADCDCIIHLAAIVGVRLAMKKGREGLKVSYLGTENVLEAATEYGKDAFIASSSAIYGKITQIPVPEDADCLLGASCKPS